LGRGRFACVKRAHRRGAGDGGVGGKVAASCALKIFDKAEFWRRVHRGQERFDTLVREAAVQAILTAAVANADEAGAFCPVVRLLGIFEDTEYLVLEMELMSERSLFHELSHDGVMEEGETARVAAGLLKAVVFMQGLGIAHRDIKLSNVLFLPADATATHRHGEVRLADFGMAGQVDAAGQLRGRCGTPGYVAPEILAAGPAEPYSNAVDVYSVGVVAYTLLCGYEPFYGRSDAELIAQNRDGDFSFDVADWGAVAMDAQDFVSRLMEKDPTHRASPQEALRHPWILRHVPWAAAAAAEA
ncbi:unnamed protein product, partial [Phaeothamnion confervicola]